MRLSFVLSVLPILVLPCLVGCGATSPEPLTETISEKEDVELAMTKRDYMRIAREAIQGKIRTYADAPVDVSYEDDRVIVTFGWRPPPGIDPSDVLGPDYTAQVTINRRSGQVLNVLGGS